MRPGRSRPLTLTRRALGTRFAGAAAAIGFGNGTAASAMQDPVPVLNPDLRDAALRGLALAGYRGDPVTAAAANAAIERLSESDPEGALLARIYQMLDVRPAQYQPEYVPEAAAADLATLHAAIRACQPVAFGYTDLSGNKTTRTVLPLALVHPPQGVKLLARCEERKDFRQFFVRAIRDLGLRAGNFTEERLALLEGLLEKEAGRSRPPGFPAAS
ncbi:WYL domain-containing protein [Rhodovulum imhoffii]|uniref:WYL domain-containing protein n=1 Tax=Rhodovulum imhoffii TaxID=365340 RepID=A0A2T5BUI3_9RHOB|nr:WYL domain-containing protein [Rhodovulum imhoffii]PTN03184.1 WYL domain-containing protein [Rhodovulum imhoffii]